MFSKSFPTWKNYTKEGDKEQSLQKYDLKVASAKVQELVNAFVFVWIFRFLNLFSSECSEAFYLRVCQSYGFSSSHVQIWELDSKKGWTLKNWCSWTVVLEKTLESPLDYKEIQPVHPKGDQSWVFFGSNDAKAETPVFWPPRAKSWLIGKDSDAGRDRLGSWQSQPVRLLPLGTEHLSWAELVQAAPEVWGHRCPAHPSWCSPEPAAFPDHTAAAGVIGLVHWQSTLWEP